MEELRSSWMHKVSHLAKACECIADSNNDSKEEICVTQIIDISVDHSYDHKVKKEKLDDSPVLNTKRKRVSFVGLLNDDDSNDDDDDDDDEDYGGGKKKKPKIKKDSDSSKSKKHKEKKKRRGSHKAGIDDDYSPSGDKLKGSVKKKERPMIRAYLNNWYEAMLMETTLTYREARKKAMTYVPDLRCCCDGELSGNTTQIQCPGCKKFQHSVCVGVKDEFDFNYPYLCFQCWPKQEHLIPSGGTVIISPAAILNQWLTEVIICNLFFIYFFMYCKLLPLK